MAVHGFVTHAAANRRKLFWLVVSYIVAFQIICAVALIVVLAVVDPGNTIITIPFGYAIRYVIPVGLLTYMLFWMFYRGHLKYVRRKLDVKIVDKSSQLDHEELRLIRIAEPVCITAGLRQPQFGLIDVAEPNALAVGSARNKGLIAVTRGLLHQLDDDELAAVIAHEAAHIRNGDTQIQAANFALMRIAVNMQVNNPLRIDSWKPLILGVAVPYFLTLLLTGGAATQLAMRLSFQARKGISDSRDFIADAEAVQNTQFPDALISALEKVDKSEAFCESQDIRPMLFAGGKPAEEENIPGVFERVKNIKSLSREMLDAGRVRRDTRNAEKSSLSLPIASTFNSAHRQRKLGPPPQMPSLSQIMLRPRIWVEWHEHCVEYYQWREHEKCNILGLTSQTCIPLIAVIAFLAIYQWPSQGDIFGTLQIFNPANLVAGWSTADGGLNFFKYASDEAAVRQTILVGAIMTVFYASMTIIIMVPRWRSKIFPHVDWSPTKLPKLG